MQARGRNVRHHGCHSETLRGLKGEHVIEVTAEEARSKGLPGIGFRVDMRGTAMSVGKFPEPGIYLIASGPPGGPLNSIVFPADGREGDASALEQAVRRHHAERWQQPLVIGEPGEVMFAGASRPALAFTTKPSPARIAWCGVLISGNGGALLVTLGHGAGQAASMSCGDIVAEPNLAAFARTFTLL
jgi:hypothetical protein